MKKTNKETIYISQLGQISGTSLKVANRRAHDYIHLLTNKTKRQPYIRSKYFKKDKIFFKYYWKHILQKHGKDRVRRLRLLPAAVDLLMHSQYPPQVEPYKDKGSVYYRFMGRNTNKELFYVQVKEDIKTGEKNFVSAFPAKQKILR